MSGDERPLLVDASAFITLAEIGQVGLLRGTQGRVLVPAAVDEEIRDDPAASRLADARNAGWIRVTSPHDDHCRRAASHLGRDLSADDGRSDGDVALLAAAVARDEGVVVSDDRPLRETCKALSVPVAGSIGVLVRAVERGALDAEAARASLYAMDEVGARLSASLVRRAERLIDEAAG